VQWLSRLLAKILPAGWTGEEESLLQTYAEILKRTGLEPDEARHLAEQGLQHCKEEARQAGTEDMPDNYGDFILQRAEEGNPKYEEMVRKAREEGATEEDIRSWWNRSDLHRRMTKWAEEVAVRRPMYETAREHGLSREEAADKVRQFFPVYGDPEDESEHTGRDRPLPYELHDRVEHYRRTHDLMQVRRKLQQHSSYNSLIRAEIEAGNL
jgi:hypothetical protein